MMGVTNHPMDALLSHSAISALGYVLICIGNTLVLSSMVRLGITGTYLGLLQCANRLKEKATTLGS
jgi:hypothetical protein